MMPARDLCLRRPLPDHLPRYRPPFYGPTHPRRQAARVQVAALYRAWGRPELLERYLAERQ